MWETTVRKAEQTEDRMLFRVLRNEAAFFDAGGYGKPFRSKWRPTLLLRDSPACINYHDTSRQNSCRECPLFSFADGATREADPVPLHSAQSTR